MVLKNFGVTFSLAVSLAKLVSFQIERIALRVILVKLPAKVVLIALRAGWGKSLARTVANVPSVTLASTRRVSPSMPVSPAILANTLPAAVLYVNHAHGVKCQIRGPPHAVDVMLASMLAQMKSCASHAKLASLQSKAAHIVPPVQRAKCQIMDLAIVSGVTLVSTRRGSLQVPVTRVILESIHPAAVLYVNHA